MFKQERKHTIDILFVLTLFCVFAISMIMLTGTGANVYSNIVDDMSSNFSSRTSFAYLTGKVHQGDETGRVSVGKYSNCDSLIISEEIDNITYCTYLYFYDGHIKEMFTRDGQSFDPEYGTDILEAQSFNVSKEGTSLIKFEISLDGKTTEPIYVHLRSRQ